MKLIGRIVTIWILGCLFCNAALGEKKKSANSPNIVFIMADDLGSGDLGCYNSDSKIPTPHMDAIAFAGIAFIFLIGGAVPLTIGFKEIKNYWNYRRNLKKEKSLKRKQNGLEMYYDKISKRYHEVKEQNSLFEEFKVKNNLSIIYQHLIII